MITLTRLAAAQYKGLIDISLRFPDRGSFLIEGRNEAGKSTLFDAVHFGLYGRPLVGDQADAIHFGADQAAVELELSVDGTHLAVRRALRQTAKTLRAEAELEVLRHTGTEAEEREVVRGTGAVNQRLQQEMGGLTAEALLNSCLVAQKQLGRLETLGRASREEALTVLLNLGKLSDVHNRLRVRPDDEDQLRRARARVDLARLTGELARLGEARAALERERHMADLRETLDGLRLAGTAREEVLREVERLTARQKELRAALGEVERLQAELAQLRRVAELEARGPTIELELTQAKEALAALAEAERELPERRAALDEAQALRAAVQALFDARTRRETLRAEAERIEVRLAERAELVARCSRLDDELAQLRGNHRDLQTAVAQLAPLTADLAASRARQVRLSTLQREAAAALRSRASVEATAQQAVRVGELLTRWLELRRQEEAAIQAKRLLDDLSLGIAAVEHVTTERRNRVSEVPGLRLRLLVDHPLTGALALQLRLWAGGAELAEARPVTPKEAERLSTSGVPTLSAAGLEEVRRDRQAVARELGELGEAEPNDVADAERRLAQPTANAILAGAEREAAALEARCMAEAAALHIAIGGESLEALVTSIAAELQREAARQAELSTSAGRREGLQGQLALLERNGKERRRELAECQASLARDSEAELTTRRAEVARQAQEADQEIGRLAAHAAAALGQHHSEDARSAAQQRVDSLAAAVAILERRLQEREALATRLEALTRTRDEWRQQLDDARREAGLSDGEAPTRIAALTQRLEVLGETGLRAEEHVIQRSLGAAEARLQRIEHDAAALTGRAVQLAADLGHAVSVASGSDIVQVMEAGLPELRGGESRAEIEAQLSALDQQRGALERGAADARALVGPDAPPAIEDAERELRALEEDLAARRRGQEIVAATRQRMIGKVLPDTIDNMCVLLPKLTAERYRYAELTPDYRLQVWDERKRAYVEKTLFSGGTQDQFSLAMRLGFALAALPRELGTSPGFLFLDEPLSSFDRDRTAALVTLLTTGQIATFFRQIFLISHSQAFDATLFSHHIVMEHGRVAESALPS